METVRKIPVYIYLLNIEQVQPFEKELLAYLSYGRRNKAVLLKNEERSLSIALGVLIKEILLYDEDSDIIYSHLGKPQTVDGYPYISFTHGGRYAGVAYSEAPIGIDIERSQPVNLVIAKRYFTQKECQYIAKRQQQEEAFLELWTKKESIMKADGRGMTIPAKEIDVLNQNKWVLATHRIDDHILSCACQKPFNVEQKMVQLDAKRLLRF